MFWETSNDKVGDESLIRTMVNTLDHNLEHSDNLLSYPDSKYNNLKGGP